MTPFLSYRQFMIEAYGTPLYRVPLDLDLSCPNREPDGSGGCAFCPAHGSRATQTLDAVTLEEQVRAGIAFARQRYGTEKFMAYIQAFTGTFSPASEQREVYQGILDLFPFDALAIGTRPDCLPLETLDYLEELNRETDLWIELGVQTIHNDSLRRINRGHTWQQSREAILELNRRGIKTAVHVILGLPGETTDHLNQTAETLARLPIHGIKIHNLHVMKETRLANIYIEDPFPVYSATEYADILIGFLRRLPPSLPIMRINTDTRDSELIAPHWDMKKPQFRSFVISRMNESGMTQGDLLIGSPSPQS